MDETAVQVEKLQEGKDLRFWEGYLSGLKHMGQLNEVVTALALYAIKQGRLYVQAGYKSFEEYVEKECEGISKRTAWRWVKDVAELTPDTFRDLSARIGVNHSLLSRFALLPADVQNAIVKGDTIEIDGTPYDLKGADKKVYREVIISLADKLKAVKDNYDTTTRYKKRNEKLEKENASLKRELAEAKKPLPEDATRALEMLAKHRDDALAAYYFLEQANPQGYPDIVLADLTNTAYFLRDLYSLLANTISNRLDPDTPYPADLLESENRSFNKKYESYLKVPGADA